MSVSIIPDKGGENTHSPQGTKNLNRLIRRDDQVALTGPAPLRQRFRHAQTQLRILHLVQIVHAYVEGVHKRAKACGNGRNARRHSGKLAVMIDGSHVRIAAFIRTGQLVQAASAVMHRLHLTDNQSKIFLRTGNERYIQVLRLILHRVSGTFRRDAVARIQALAIVRNGERKALNRVLRTNGPLFILNDVVALIVANIERAHIVLSRLRFIGRKHADIHRVLPAHGISIEIPRESVIVPRRRIRDRQNRARARRINRIIIRSLREVETDLSCANHVHLFNHGCIDAAQHRGFRRGNQGDRVVLIGRGVIHAIAVRVQIFMINLNIRISPDLQKVRRRAYNDLRIFFRRNSLHVASRQIQRRRGERAVRVDHAHLKRIRQRAVLGRDGRHTGRNAGHVAIFIHSRHSRIAAFKAARHIVQVVAGVARLLRSSNIQQHVALRRIEGEHIHGVAGTVGRVTAARLFHGVAHVVIPFISRLRNGERVTCYAILAVYRFFHTIDEVLIVGRIAHGKGADEIVVRIAFTQREKRNIERNLIAGRNIILAAPGYAGVVSQIGILQRENHAFASFIHREIIGIFLNVEARMRRAGRERIVDVRSVDVKRGRRLVIRCKRHVCAKAGAFVNNLSLSVQILAENLHIHTAAQRRDIRRGAEGQGDIAAARNDLAVVSVHIEVGRSIRARRIIHTHAEGVHQTANTRGDGRNAGGDSGNLTVFIHGRNVRIAAFVLAVHRIQSRTIVLRRPLLPDRKRNVALRIRDVHQIDAVAP